MITPHTNFHRKEIGYTSPYPTVDIVTIAHRILFGILENQILVDHSTTYIRNEAIIQLKRKNTQAILYL